MEFNFTAFCAFITILWYLWVLQFLLKLWECVQCCCDSMLSSLQKAGWCEILKILLCCILFVHSRVQCKVTNGKAHNLLWACRRACGMGCGLGPKVVHWLYVAIVGLTISYASLVWWPGCQMASTKNKLSKVERLACLGITGTFRTTTGAMEMLVGLPLLNLVIQGEARLVAHRLCSLACWSYLHPQQGHSCILTRLQKSDPIFNMRVDIMKLVFNLEPKYRVTMLAREEWTGGSGTTPMIKGLVLFTDGSRIAEGTRAGVYGQSSNRRLGIPLGKHATVFQAEVYAILACVHETETQDRPEKYISICSDS